MNKIKYKHCIVCLKEFAYNTSKASYGMRGRGKRLTDRNKTCSRDCSKVYARISGFVHSKWIPKKR